MKSFRSIALVAPPLFALAIAACSSTMTAPDDGAKRAAAPNDPRTNAGGASSGGTGSGAPRGDDSSNTNTNTSTALDASTQSDADVAPVSWCGALGAKMDRCDHERACGDKFDAWCTKFSTMNSAIYAEADAACLMATCEVSARSDCRFRHYRREALSASQTALLNAYCASCGGLDCAERTLIYNSAAGPSSVSDAFIAIWELSDSIVDTIRTRCTGPRATDAGAGDASDTGDAGSTSDRAACVHDFGQCAADVYFEVLPDCL